MESKQRILLTIGIVVVLLGGFFLVTDAITKYTGFSITPETDNDGLKGCLKEKDISLYINAYDSAETLRRLKLVEYLEGVKIQNCNIDNSDCLNKKIDSFPMWIIEGNMVSGDITIDKLIKYSGCIFAE